MNQLNQRGIATVFTLAFVPLFLVLLYLLLQLFLAMQLHAATHFQCRRLLLRGQTQLGLLLTQLLAMNREARTLQEEETMAKIMLANAVFPAAIAAAQAKLKAVQLRQEVLGLAQRSVLLAARARAARMPFEVQTTAEFREAQFTAQGLPHPKGLAVEPQPPFSRAPVYTPVPGFETAQTARLRWRVRLKNLIPRFLAPHLALPQYMNGHCAATLRKERKEWKPKLTRANL
jgi:hypothetical protein